VTGTTLPIDGGTSNMSPHFEKSSKRLNRLQMVGGQE